MFMYKELYYMMGLSYDKHPNQHTKNK